jgi:hypothetical protein
LVRFTAPRDTTAGLRLMIEVLVGAIAYSGCLFLLHRARLTAFLSLWRQRTA